MVTTMTPEVEATWQEVTAAYAELLQPAYLLLIPALLFYIITMVIFVKLRKKIRRKGDIWVDQAIADGRVIKGYLVKFRNRVGDRSETSSSLRYDHSTGTYEYELNGKTRKIKTSFRTYFPPEEIDIYYDGNHVRTSAYRNTMGLKYGLWHFWPILGLLCMAVIYTGLCNLFGVQP